MIASAWPVAFAFSTERAHRFCRTPNLGDLTRRIRWATTSLISWQDFRNWLALELSWQRDLKNSAVFGTSRGGRELALMAVDDHFGYGQTKTLAFRFGRDEGIEDSIDHSRIDSLSGVLNRNADCSLPAAFRLDPQEPGFLHRFHCIDRVLHEVDDNFLQLAVMSGDRRQIRRELRQNRNVMPLELFVHESERLANKFVHIGRVRLLIVA